MFSLDRIFRDRFTLNGLLPCSVSIPHMKGDLANGAVRLPYFVGATQQDEAITICFEGRHACSRQWRKDCDSCS